MNSHFPKNKSELSLEKGFNTPGDHFPTSLSMCSEEKMFLLRFLCHLLQFL